MLFAFLFILMFISTLKYCRLLRFNLELLGRLLLIKLRIILLFTLGSGDRGDRLKIWIATLMRLLDQAGCIRQIS